MLYVKNISYILSHIFFLTFLYLFLVHRYSRKKTLFICFLSFLVTTVLNQLKLNVFPDSALFYFFTTIIQIINAQLTGLLISERRDSRTLFVGLSASNYVLIGTIIAPILYILTDNVILALAGNLLVHIIFLTVLYFTIRNIIIKFCKRDSGKSQWEICLIPTFFYCSFSSMAFFPFTLYEHHENILPILFLMITLLVSYVVVMRYMDSETRRLEDYWKNVMSECYIKGLESQNYLVAQAEQNLRILRHDMRHYSMMIDSLLDQKDYDEIRKLAGHINEVVYENKVERYCENLALNTILRQMALQAKSFDIAMNLDVLIAKQLPVNEYEFALVLANLLENAVFGTKNLEQEQKYINAKIRCTAQYLLIDMCNACEKDIRFDSLTGLPKSEKGDSHGLGMLSVLTFADKLGGNLDCYCENGRFRIILYADLTDPA